MLKIRTHKDAFKAFLAPEKYDAAGDCVFCIAANDDCAKCTIGFICGHQWDFPFIWPAILIPDKSTIARYILRTCKDWGRKNIERVARKKAIALGYKFQKVER